MEEVQAHLEMLMAKARDPRARLVFLCAAFLKPRAAQLVTLRVREVEPLFQAALAKKEWPETFQVWVENIVRKELRGRNPEDFVLKGRNAKGQVPVSRVALWRILFPIAKLREIRTTIDALLSRNVVPLEENKWEP